MINRPDGTTRAAEIRYVPRYIADGSIDGIYVLIIDIEERKRSEREILLSNSRFRAAVEAVHGVLWTNSAEGRMLGEQPAWAALTGQTRKNIRVLAGRMPSILRTGRVCRQLEQSGCGKVDLYLGTSRAPP